MTSEAPARAPPARPKSIGHYVLLKTIGEGTFGKVKLGTHILTGERVAVKVLEKERIVELADVERVARELHILKLIRHPHIIQLYEIIETPRQLYLIMEYAPGGELFDYIVEHNRAEEPQACRFLHQIVAGVEKVHAMRVVHRDLKPENLLLDERKDIKIADFGLSNTYKEGQRLQTACGSPCYAAPEMIAGHRYDPSMVDVWSCGVILFALVCGYLPFENENHSELYKKILNAEYEVPDNVSNEVADLISGMLTTDPTRRMTLDDIQKHIWYNHIGETSLPKTVVAANGEIILDEEIIEQLDVYGFPREYSMKCIKTNKHNHVTTTYYLLKEKRSRMEAEGRSSAPLAIADLDATGFEENDAASMAAAVAAVATPSRNSGHEADRNYGRRPHSARASGAPAWLDADGAMPLPRKERSAGSARGSGTPRGHRQVAGGAARSVPPLNLNNVPRVEQRRRPQSARAAAAAAAASAVAEVMAYTGAGASCSRSPASRPPAAPGSCPADHGSANGHDAPPGWAPEPQRLAFEELRVRSAYEDGGSYDLADAPAVSSGRHTERRTSSNTASSRRSGRTPRATSDGCNTRAPQETELPARKRSTAASSPGARPRLQGNAHGHREQSFPRGGIRGVIRSTGRQLPSSHPEVPETARASGGRHAMGHESADSHAHAHNARSSNSIHVSCKGAQNPREVIQELLRVLAANRITSRQISGFLVRAQGHGSNPFRLEAEVLQTDRGGRYVLQLSRVAGNVEVFKDVCGQLVADMQI